jgi:hypothetical protein
LEFVSAIRAGRATVSFFNVRNREFGVEDVVTYIVDNMIKWRQSVIAMAGQTKSSRHYGKTKKGRSAAAPVAFRPKLTTTSHANFKD